MRFNDSCHVCEILITLRTKRPESYLPYLTAEVAQTTEKSRATRKTSRNIRRKQPRAVSDQLLLHAGFLIDADKIVEELCRSGRGGGARSFFTRRNTRRRRTSEKFHTLATRAHARVRESFSFTSADIRAVEVNGASSSFPRISRLRRIVCIAPSRRRFRPRRS